MPDDSSYLPPGRAALIARVNPKTIARWCDQGKFGPPVRTKKGQRRIPADLLTQFLAEREKGEDAP